MHFRNATVAGLVLLTLSAGASFALDRKLTVYNKSGYTITEFYGSNSGSNNWEEDILGKDVLPPGGSVTIDFNDGTGYCMFDFLVKFEDGDEMTDKIDVCTVGTYNITN
ncbi:hypothetical protein [Paenirhodobacter hankyongi]|nr:hypothetical protein [Sinirhodobacter hankyongi]